MATIPVELVGGIVKAADFNFLIGGSSGQRPSFQAVQNAAQSVPNSTVTQAIYQSVIRDSDSGYNSGTGLYTIQTPGFWLFSCSMQYASNGTGNRQLTFNVGPEQASSWVTAGVDPFGRLGVSLVAFLSGGQNVTVQMVQSSGGALNTSGTSNNTFSGVWICS